MNELRRLGSEDRTAAALFEAARAYRPPVRARRGIMRALGIPIGVTMLSSTLVQAAQAVLPIKAWIVAGVITASAGGGAIYLSQQRSPPRAAVAVEARRPTPQRPRPVAPAAVTAPISTVALVPAPVAPAPTARRIARRSVTPDRVNPPSPPLLVPVTAPPPPPVAPAGPVASGGAPALVPPPLPPAPPALTIPQSRSYAPPAAVLPPVAAPRSSLEVELALIERARRPTGEAPGRALTTLDEYARSFPQGVLVEEAAVLRLTALAASGQRGEAAARAEAFLRAHPRSPLAARARSFLLTPSTAVK
jgi:hypothetical protein